MTPSSRDQTAAACNQVVAVVAHARKTLGGGLGELRAVLASEGVTDPIWLEVKKSRKAPARVRRALDQGAELIFVWGGDGTVQRCIDAVAEKDVALAILPAGTANLLATNLGIPSCITGAVKVGLQGDRRPLDTGTVNGEHFAVLAGAGFDARMIGDANRKMKDRLGRMAYIYTGARNMAARPVKATVEVDGERFVKDRVSCVLAGNVGRVLGGIEAFPDARPDDGLLELGVVTARNPVEWARTLGRVAFGRAESSPFVEVTRGKQAKIKFSKQVPYELDGGARPPARKLCIEVHPAAVRVCVPRPD
jgi:diacylglycerol kinase (ATP)